MTHTAKVKLNCSNFLMATLHMDTLTKGAFFMLIIASIDTKDHRLLNNDQGLARIAGVTPKMWKLIKPTLSKKFIISSEYWSLAKPHLFLSETSL